MTTGNDDDNSNKDQASIARAQAIVHSLPPEKAAKLLSELPTGGRQEEAVAPIRSALVERLNQLRPQRARRLFTSLLQPFLIDDMADDDPPFRIPFAFHRTDIGAIWAAMARSVFPDKAAEATQLMDELCRDQLVDDALTLPEARAMREKLRQAAHARLSTFLTDRSANDAFVTLANALRDRLSPQDRHGAVPIGWPLIQELVEVLGAYPLVTPVVSDFLAQTPPHADSEATARSLIDATIALGRQLGAAGLQARTAEILPAALLIGRGAYGAVARYLSERGFASAPRVAQGLAAEMADRLSALARDFQTLLPETRRDDGPLAVDPDAVDRLQSRMHRLEEIILAVRHSGLLDSRELQPVLRDVVNDAVARLEHGPLGRLTRRFAAALASRGHAVGDSADIRRLTTLLVRLRAALRPTDLPIFALNRWRDQLLAEVEGATQRAARIEAEEDAALSERFAHLERIETLAEVAGATIVPMLQPSSRHTQLVVAARLSDPRPFSPVAQRLCAGFAATVRGEIAKVRYWRNPDMLSIDALAAARGI
ncbi:hypothetical protein [Zavarzinia sp.]|uniref:hypothetical protein n=1 Tax=Zavarzinia sp. TaxID=2027920 RepID=UPI0035633905